MNTSIWVSRHRRLILCVGTGLIAAWYAILLGAFVLVPTLKCAIQARAVEVLRNEFGTDVRFQSFNVTFWPRVHIVASGLLIANNPSRPPIPAATADADSDLLPSYIRTLVLAGFSLHIPTAKGQNVAPLETAFAVTIDQIVSKRAQLAILPADGRQIPFHFELANLRVKKMSPGSAAGFSPFIVSSEPRTQMDPSGLMGPRNALQYKMVRSDQTTMPGLQGRLSSQGRLQSVVKRLDLAGHADASRRGLSVSRRSEQ